MKIGIFDSGIGGLSVLASASEKISADFVYYADTDNVPYGEKKKDEIVEYSFKAISFLIEKGVDAIVVACNTATSAGIGAFRERYSLPIIGMEPAVKRARDLYGDRGKIIVSATDFTIRGGKLSRLISSLGVEDKVSLLPLSGLVRFAEIGDFESDEVHEYLKNALSGQDIEKSGSFVLGCTHFIFYKGLIRSILPSHIEIVDGNEGTVNQLIRRINKECANADVKGEGRIEYYLSGRETTEAEREKYNRLVLRARKE